LRVYRVGDEAGNGPEFTTPSPVRSPAAIHTSSLGGDDWQAVAGLPTTTRGRTLIDVAGRLDTDELAHIVDGFVSGRWVTGPQLRRDMTARLQSVGLGAVRLVGVTCPTRATHRQATRGRCPVYATARPALTGTYAPRRSLPPPTVPGPWTWHCRCPPAAACRGAGHRRDRRDPRRARHRVGWARALQQRRPARAALRVVAQITAHQSTRDIRRCFTLVPSTTHHGPSRPSGDRRRRAPHWGGTVLVPTSHRYSSVCHRNGV
jgi:hypothetical protein